MKNTTITHRLEPGLVSVIIPVYNDQAGIKESSYDLICFQDSDAKWYPNK